MKLKIALLPGDGIGPEIVGEAVKVLDSVAAKYGHQFEYSKALVGACAIDATGDPYPAETHAVCEASDVVLFGAIGDPKYDNNPAAKVRPEQGLLRMRKSLGLFANLRPLAVFDSLAGRSPLKTEIVKGADFICVRELTGGMYFGRPQGRSEDGNTAYDTCVYTREEIERIAGLQEAERRKQKKLEKSYEDFMKLLTFVETVEDDDFWRSEVVQITAKTTPSGALEVELTPRSGRFAVLFGRLEDVERKFDKLLRFYRSGLSSIGWSEYRTIDIRYNDQVVCKK